MNNQYPIMANILKPIKIGRAEVDILDYTNKKLGLWETISGLRNQRYARLLVDGSTIMSDTPMEHRTNQWFVLNSYGDVLIGGLGIGMIVLAIQNKDNVNSITVLEKSQDVIDCVLPQLPLNDKVKIIQADVFTYKPETKYDCIYMDIWSYVNCDVYEEMKQLKRKYGHYLKPKSDSPNRFNECWAEDYARTETRLY